ncbi:unnamed protein product, partial [Discosporangium mesarthrocarpum]
METEQVRYPVILKPYEKLIAQKVCKAFGQMVCGFDLLRVGVPKHMSYVCDVNGWSFVKNNLTYYTDCASLISQLMVQATRP